MRFWRRGIWAVAVMMAGAVLAAATVKHQFTDPAVLTTVLGFVLSVTGLAVTLVKDGPPGSGAESASAERLDRAAEQLAAAVREQWQSEWRLRRLQDPEPLQVRWSAAEAWMSDHLENVGGAPLDLPDWLDHIADAHGLVAPRRLAVLGGPGSGKSVLALRFTLDVLARRQPGQPVPVIFSPSNWQADREFLYAWLADRLAEDYPALAARNARGVMRARELLDSGRILPVIDGLDEMPHQLQSHAIRRLNAELDASSPFLLTCRTQMYERAVESGDVFTAAAVVELRPLDFEDAAAYLVRTARPVRGDGGDRSTRWDDVVSHMRRPDDPAGSRLRQVLSAPLMVAMARSVYDDANADPRELLGLRFASTADLEHHLLDAFVPAAFAEERADDADSGQTRWDGEDARRWLGFLASHLQHRDTRDLEWWELSSALPSPLRRYGPILCVGAPGVAVSLLWLAYSPGIPYWALGIVLGVCAGYGLLAAHRGMERRPLMRRAALGLAGTVLLGIALGFAQDISFYWTDFDPAPGGRGPAGWAVWGMVGGMATAVVLTVIGIEFQPRPSTVPLRAMQRARSAMSRVVGGTAVLLAAATAFGISFFLSPPPFYSSVGSSLRVPGVVAVMVGLLVAAAVRSNSGMALHTEHSGMRPFRTRRVEATGRSLLHGLALGLLAGLVFGIAFGTADAAVLGIRSATQSDFPTGSSVRPLPNGARYATAPDGWGYGRLTDSSRYVRTPQPVHGVTVTDKDGRHSHAVTAEDYKLVGCGSGARCTPFVGRIEIHMKRGDYDHMWVRLPDRALIPVSDRDAFNALLSPAPGEWLFTRRPSELFGSAASFGLASGLVLGIVGGLASCLYRLLDSPVDVTRAPSPVASLDTDRATAVTRGVIIMVFGIVVSLLLVPWLPSSELSQVIMAGVWLLASPLAVGLSAWGWLLTTRLWLCGTGRLPWRLMTFLEEAHRRGVLRQAGAVYQFRHARLQERLASRTDGTDRPPRGTATGP
ncbi:NACHT domain-containing protein [Streptomyces mirabilis]|uniref:NACHT domain-containing protein n=1 Tax=Streptomyces mirabilis TaxID=68239 RepID=UPI00382F1A3C